MNYGEWLSWCWVCGIRNHLVHLNIEKVDFVDEANIMEALPWWLKARLLWIYSRYWETVGDIGVRMASLARNRLGYLPKLGTGF